MRRKIGVHGHALVQKGKQILSQLVAVFVGFALMVIGLGLGVTMIMLPVGLAVGLVGVLLFIWGLFGHLQDRKGTNG